MTTRYIMWLEGFYCTELKIHSFSQMRGNVYWLEAWYCAPSAVIFLTVVILSQIRTDTALQGPVTLLSWLVFLCVLWLVVFSLHTWSSEDAVAGHDCIISLFSNTALVAWYQYKTCRFCVASGDLNVFGAAAVSVWVHVWCTCVKDKKTGELDAHAVVGCDCIISLFSNTVWFSLHGTSKTCRFCVASGDLDIFSAAAVSVCAGLLLFGVHVLKTRKLVSLMYTMKWCLMPSDVIWHIRLKLRPMLKHGSI